MAHSISSGPEAEITHRRILTIAGPIVLSNATVPILGAVDMGVVGQIGEAAPLAAVGSGAVILSAIYWIFGFLRMGTAGLAAQAAGRGDTVEVAALLLRSLLIGLAGGVLVLLLQGPLFAGAFRVSPASEEVEDLARLYMSIRVWSAPAAIAVYGLTGWLIAQERTTAVLVLQLWMNGVNIALDLWFVLGLGWGVEGVAIATFLAEWSALALGLWLCRGAFAVPAARAMSRLFDIGRLVVMAQVNRDILLRSLLLQVIFVSFPLFGARFGDETLAANLVLINFMSVTAYAMDGFAFAAEAIVGRAYGAGDVRQLRRGAVMTSIWGLGANVVFAVVFWTAGPVIIDVMTEASAVQSEARDYLIYMALAPILGTAAWMLDGIFIGATRGADMRNMMAVSCAAYLLAVYALVPPFGNHGLWAAMLLSFVVRGLTLGLRYPALERAAVQESGLR